VIELEVVELEGEYLMPMEGPSYVIDCTVVDAEEEKTMESVVIVTL
jgi:hypothetical protein